MHGRRPLALACDRRNDPVADDLLAPAAPDAALAIIAAGEDDRQFVLWDDEEDLSALAGRRIGRHSDIYFRNGRGARGPTLGARI